MMCVKSVQYVVVVNRVPCDNIHPTRGSHFTLLISYLCGGVELYGIIGESRWSFNGGS